MSLNIGELVGYIKLDGTGVGQGIQDAQKRLRDGMDKMSSDGAAQGEKTGKTIGQRLSGAFGDSVKELGQGLVAAFAVSKVVSYIRGTIDAASDLAETVNYSSTIFGQNQAVIEGWAKNAARNLGLSSEAAMRNAANFGDMFLQLGFASAAATSMSQGVVQMAADLGSFKNLGTEDVLQRIAAGFRGEYDSLQLLIPNISAARVEQEALAASGKSNAAALTAQEKATAVLAIVQRDGARAVGDFAKTSDSAATSSKTAAAAAQDLAAKIGNVLLPAYTALVQFGRDAVIPFLAGTVDAATAAAAAVGPLVSAFASLPGPLQGALVGMLVLLAAGDRLASFGNNVRTHVIDASKAAGSGLDTLRLRAMYAGDAAAAAGGGFKGMASAIGTAAGAGVRGAASGLLSVLGGPWGIAFTAAVAAVGGFAQAQVNARKAAEDLSRTLDAQTGAVTKATREMALKKLLDDFSAADWRKVGEEAGIGIDQVVTALTGSQPELDAFRERFDSIQTAMMASGDPEVSARWEAFGNTIAASSRDLDGARLIAEQTRLGMAGFSETTTSTTSAVDKQKAAVEALRAANERLAGNYADAVSAAVSYEASLDDLTDTITKNGATLDIGTAAGRANQSALIDNAKAAQDAALASLKHGEGVSAVADTMDARREAFIQQAMRITGNRDAAAAMADQLGLTRAKVDQLSASIRETPDGKAVQIVVEDADARARIESFKALLSTVQNRIVRIDAATGWSGQRYGSIMQFARGGFRGAWIYSDGADIVRFAERGTGGEAYIPLGLSNRARSTQILAETNRRLGDPLDKTAGASQVPAEIVISGTLATAWGPAEVRGVVSEALWTATSAASISARKAAY